MAEPSTERVARTARQAGLNIVIKEMPESTRTANEAAIACGNSVNQIVKSLVFRLEEKKELVLLLVSGANRVHEKRVGRQLNDKLKRANPDDVRRVTGFAIGGVSPLGSLSPLRTFIDSDLFAFETVWAAAGAPNTVFEANPKELAEAIDAECLVMT